MKILNIHGYGGAAHNTIYKILNEICPNQVISPQFDYDTYAPDTVVSILDRLVEDEQIGMIVGTSLGGFFACCISQKHELPRILVNPCLLPFITLRQISGAYNFARYGRQLFELFGKHMGNLDRRYLSTVIGKSDEVIDHQATTAYLVKSNRWYEIDGGHHLEHTDELSAVFQEIMNYYNDNLSKIQESETVWTI